MHGLLLPQSTQPSFGQGFARNRAESVNPELWDGLVGAWVPALGATGGTLRDVSGLRQDMPLTMPVSSWKTSVIGTVLDFDGVNDGAAQVDFDGGVISGYPFTINAWFLASNITDYHGLVWIGDGDEDAVYDVLLAAGGDTGDPIWAASAMSGVYPVAKSTSGYLSNTWHLATGLWKSTSLRTAMLDAGSAGSATTTATPSRYTRTSLGRYGDHTPNFYLDGCIGAAYIHIRILSDAEIRQLYVDPLAPFRLAPIVIGKAPAGGTAYTLEASSGSFAVTGTAADLLHGRVLSAGSGSYTVTGTATDLLYGRVLTAASGSFAVTGADADLLYGRVLAAASGSYVVTGTAADLLYGRVLAAASGSFAVTGTDADLIYSGVTYTLSALSGSFAITGTAADLLHNHVLTASAGSYIVTGTAADLIYSGVTYTLDALSGSFAITGTAADLLYGRVLSAASGTYAVTGTAAALTYTPVSGSHPVSTLGRLRLLPIASTRKAFTAKAYTPVVRDILGNMTLLPITSMRRSFVAKSVSAPNIINIGQVRLTLAKQASMTVELEKVTSMTLSLGVES